MGWIKEAAMSRRGMPPHRPPCKNSTGCPESYRILPNTNYAHRRPTIDLGGKVQSAGTSVYFRHHFYPFAFVSLARINFTARHSAVETQCNPGPPNLEARKPKSIDQLHSFGGKGRQGR